MTQIALARDSVIRAAKAWWRDYGDVARDSLRQYRNESRLGNAVKRLVRIESKKTRKRG